MEFYKEFFAITIEICFAIFIIIFGGTLWNTFDFSDYNTASYYANSKEFDMHIDEGNYIGLLNNEQEVTYTNLYLHNMSGKRNINNLLIKISKDNDSLKNNTIIKINENYYELNNLECIEDDYFYYFKIENIDFNGYETKEYKLKILLKENINNEYLNYEFMTNL